MFHPVHFVRGGVVLHTLTGGTSGSVDAPLHAAAAFCIDPTAHPVAEAYPAAFALLDGGALSDAKDAGTCADMGDVAVRFSATLANATTCLE